MESNKKVSAFDEAKAVAIILANTKCHAKKRELRKRMDELFPKLSADEIEQIAKISIDSYDYKEDTGP